METETKFPEGGHEKVISGLQKKKLDPNLRFSYQAPVLFLMHVLEKGGQGGGKRNPVKYNKHF